MFFRASFTTEINTLSATHSMTKPEVKWRRRWSFIAPLALTSLRSAVLFGLWCFCQKQVVSIERYFSRSTMQWRQPWQLGGRSRSREVAVPRISREKVPKKLEIQKRIIEIECKLPTMRASIKSSSRRLWDRFRLRSEESEGDVHDGRLGGARGWGPHWLKWWGGGGREDQDSCYQINLDFGLRNVKNW